jgi:predicted NBD/HSP70 family sugar kinase
MNASSQRLLQRVKNLYRNDAMLLDLCSGDIDKLDFGILKRAYEKGHIGIKDELDKTVVMISMAIGNINAILDFDTVVLGGSMATLGEYYIISIKKAVGQICHHTPYITYSTLKDNSTVYGAFALGQEYILKGIL